MARRAIALLLALAAMLAGRAAAQQPRFAPLDPIAGLKGGKAAVGGVASLVGVWTATVTQDSINLIIKKDTKGKFLTTLGIAAPDDNGLDDGLIFSTTGENTKADAAKTALGTVRAFICDSRYKGRVLVLGSGAVAGDVNNYLAQVYKKGSGSSAVYFLAGTQLDETLSDATLDKFILQRDAAVSNAFAATTLPKTASSECGFLSV